MLVSRDAEHQAITKSFEKMSSEELQREVQQRLQRLQKPLAAVHTPQEETKQFQNSQSSVLMASIQHNGNSPLSDAAAVEAEEEHSSTAMQSGDYEDGASISNCASMLLVGAAVHSAVLRSCSRAAYSDTDGDADDDLHTARSGNCSTIQNESQNVAESSVLLVKTNSSVAHKDLLRLQSIDERQKELSLLQQSTSSKSFHDNIINNPSPINQDPLFCRVAYLNKYSRLSRDLQQQQNGSPNSTLNGSVITNSVGGASHRTSRSCDCCGCSLTQREIYACQSTPLPLQEETRDENERKKLQRGVVHVFCVECQRAMGPVCVLCGRGVPAVRQLHLELEVATNSNCP